MKKLKKTSPHLFLGILLSVAILLAYSLDGLTTGSFWDQGTETNPFVRALSFEYYPFFTALRALIALVILWCFLPRSLEETLPNPTPLKMILHPIPYQKKIFLLPTYFLFYLILIKTTAALSNSALILWGEPLLLTWREAFQKERVLQFCSLWGIAIVLSHFLAQWSLYWLWKQQRSPIHPKRKPYESIGNFSADKVPSL